MTPVSTPIEGLYILNSNVLGDKRGYFLESYRADLLGKAGLGTLWLQDNISHSQKGVLRGLHFQKPPFQQAKIVRVVSGRALDVAVDLRPNSSTFGRHFSVVLDDQRHQALYIPEGFAHGFYTLSESATFYYKCSQLYSPEHEGGILWSDPDLGIPWNASAPVISEKDSAYPLFKDVKIDLLTV